MARGWESKSVEEQMEASELRNERRAQIHASEAQIALERERESIELSRTRVLNDLAEAKNPRYRASLEAALEHLNAKLQSLAGK